MFTNIKAISLATPGLRASDSNTTGVDLSEAQGPIRILLHSGNNTLNASTMSVGIQTSNALAGTYASLSGITAYLDGTAQSTGNFATITDTSTAGIQELVIDARQLGSTPFVRVQFDTTNTSNANVSVTAIIHDRVV